MKFRRTWAAVVFICAVAASISACGSNKAESTTTASEATTTAATVITTADTSKATETDAPDKGITEADKEDSSDDTSDTIDPAALIGSWTDKESLWKDTYFFGDDGYGSYTSGFENTFTYSLEGNILTVFYAEDDIHSFTVTSEGETLTLVDEYKNQQSFVKADEEAENDSDSEENPYATAIIGTWKEGETGYEETFTFNADGTGISSRIDEGIYECGFTYNFFRSNYVDIYYDNDDIGGFWIAIDGDRMAVKNDNMMEITYIRQ